ncbi:DUF2207 domain-containing protein [Salipiger sp. PrR003]|uniref:DUF2207 domain-containing protein n=1 Tax=Salipiger sp. PrR003 TaxID=2706776 RepID=UPI0013D91C0A|nr:DUF2207 domain-containing protein [Salipiger sp. PrR003]
MLKSALLALALLSGAARAEEVIQEFSSEIALEENGLLTVTEVISVRSEGDAIRHGIYRDFPRGFAKAGGGPGRASFEIVSVERDGEKEPWTAEEHGDTTRITIGEDSELLSQGNHLYKLVYQTDRQVHFRDGYDQLSWNVTGTGWPFPILSVSARVSLPDGVRPTNFAVYTGAEGERGRDAEAWYEGYEVFFETTRALSAYEGLTVDLELPQGAILAPSETLAGEWWWRDNHDLVYAFGALFVALVYFISVWTAVGRDPTPGVVVPRWDLPEGISPAIAQYVDDGAIHGASRKGVAASAIALAVSGFLKIENPEKTPTLQRTTAHPPADLPAEQLALIEAVDNKGGSLSLERSNSLAIQGMIERLARSVSEAVDGHFIQSNRSFFAVGFCLSLALLFGYYLASDIGDDDATMLGVTAALPFFLGLGVWKLLKAIHRSPSAAVVTLLVGLIAVLGASGVLAFVFFLSLMTDYVGAATAIGSLSLCWGLVVLNQSFFILIQKPSQEGQVLRDHLAGLRMYLGTAERDRLNMPGAPTMSPSHFETLLPYAVALGVENPWARQFAAWLQSATPSGNLYDPYWYPDFSPEAFADLGTNLGNAAFESLPEDSEFGEGSSGSGGGGGGGGGW